MSYLSPWNYPNPLSTSVNNLAYDVRQWAQLALSDGKFTVQLGGINTHAPVPDEVMLDYAFHDETPPTAIESVSVELSSDKGSAPFSILPIELRNAAVRYNSKQATALRLPPFSMTDLPVYVMANMNTLPGSGEIGTTPDRARTLRAPEALGFMSLVGIDLPTSFGDRTIFERLCQRADRMTYATEKSVMLSDGRVVYVRGSTERLKTDDTWSTAFTNQDMLISVQDTSSGTPSVTDMVLHSDRGDRSPMFHGFFTHEIPVEGSLAPNAPIPTTLEPIRASSQTVETIRSAITDLF